MFKCLLCSVALIGLGCSVSTTTQSTDLHASATGKLDGWVRDMDPEDLGRSSTSTSLGDVRLLPRACQGFDLDPEYDPIDAESFYAHLRSQGLAFTVERARTDLVYVDIPGSEGSSRLRVATLPSAPEAGRHLHEALLQHGKGSWGVHRSNVAVLGPIGSVDDVLDFAVSSKLACWGVLTVSGRDDSFVVPGGYQEL